MSTRRTLDILHITQTTHMETEQTPLKIWDMDEYAVPEMSGVF